MDRQERKALFEELHNQGQTMSTIGAATGISRQRVQQILKKPVKSVGRPRKMGQLKLPMKVRNLAQIEKHTLNKIRVITYYGNGKCACVLCGYKDIRALSIDHINGGGAKHLKSLHKTFYDWLIEKKFPKGYRTLCMNCQWVTRAENHFVRGPIGK